MLDAPTFDWRAFENEPRTAMRLLECGCDAVRFLEGDERYVTVAVLNPSCLVWHAAVESEVSAMTSGLRPEDWLLPASSSQR